MSGFAAQSTNKFLHVLFSPLLTQEYGFTSWYLSQIIHKKTMGTQYMLKLLEAEISYM